MIQGVRLRLSDEVSEDGTIDFADISIEMVGNSLVIVDDNGLERFGVYYADGALRVVAWSTNSGEVTNELESRVE